MSSIAAADLLAANDLLSRWSHWMNRRAEVQAKRKRRDEDIFGLFSAAALVYRTGRGLSQPVCGIDGVLRPDGAVRRADGHAGGPEALELPPDRAPRYCASVCSRL
jgi:hypothetical protein